MGYIKEWRECLESIPDLHKSEASMQLSKETLEGRKITGYYVFDLMVVLSIAMMLKACRVL